MPTVEDLLVREIESCAHLQLGTITHPFETIAICILPNHLHALVVPTGDADFPLR